MYDSGKEKGDITLESLLMSIGGASPSSESVSTGWAASKEQPHGASRDAAPEGTGSLWAALGLSDDPAQPHEDEQAAEEMTLDTLLSLMGSGPSERSASTSYEEAPAETPAPSLDVPDALEHKLTAEMDEAEPVGDPEIEPAVEEEPLAEAQPAFEPEYEPEFKPESDAETPSMIELEAVAEPESELQQDHHENKAEPESEEEPDGKAEAAVDKELVSEYAPEPDAFVAPAAEVELHYEAEAEEEASPVVERELVDEREPYVIQEPAFESEIAFEQDPESNQEHETISEQLEPEFAAERDFAPSQEPEAAVVEQVELAAEEQQESAFLKEQEREIKPAYQPELITMSARQDSASFDEALPEAEATTLIAREEITEDVHRSEVLPVREKPLPAATSADRPSVARKPTPRKVSVVKPASPWKKALGITLIALALIALVLSICFSTGVLHIPAFNDYTVEDTKKPAQAGVVAYEYSIEGFDGESYTVRENAQFDAKGELAQSQIIIGVPDKETGEAILEQMQADFGSQLTDSNVTDTAVSFTVSISEYSIDRDTYQELLTQTVTGLKVLG